MCQMWMIEVLYASEWVAMCFFSSFFFVFFSFVNIKLVSGLARLLFIISCCCFFYFYISVYIMCLHVENILMCLLQCFVMYSGADIVIRNVTISTEKHTQKHKHMHKASDCAIVSRPSSFCSGSCVCFVVWCILAAGRSLISHIFFHMHSTET